MIHTNEKPWKAILPMIHTNRKHWKAILPMIEKYIDGFNVRSPKDSCRDGVTHRRFDDYPNSYEIVGTIDDKSYNEIEAALSNKDVDSVVCCVNLHHNIIPDQKRDYAIKHINKATTDGYIDTFGMKWKYARPVPNTLQDMKFLCIPFVSDITDNTVDPYSEDREHWRRVLPLIKSYISGKDILCGETVSDVNNIVKLHIVGNPQFLSSPENYHVLTLADKHRRYIYEENRAGRGVVCNVGNEFITAETALIVKHHDGNFYDHEGDIWITAEVVLYDEIMAHRPSSGEILH